MGSRRRAMPDVALAVLGAGTGRAEEIEPGRRRPVSPERRLGGQMHVAREGRIRPVRRPADKAVTHRIGPAIPGERLEFGFAADVMLPEAPLPDRLFAPACLASPLRTGWHPARKMALIDAQRVA